MTEMQVGISIQWSFFLPTVAFQVKATKEGRSDTRTIKKGATLPLLQRTQCCAMTSYVHGKICSVPTRSV